MNLTQENDRLSRMGWAILLSALIAAGLLRFWALGDLPPGLYRDEAVNGLDAQAVLDGTSEELTPFYFSANNGREPLYIYLTSGSLLLFGNTALAVRFAAAAAGTLTVFVAYLLGSSWFGKRTGLLTAWLWAVTLWPVHLSRIGLRPILLPLMLGLSLWLATEAYRRSMNGRGSPWLWMLAGAVYGLSFYTYLPIRFTPLLLLVFLLYLILTVRHRALWPGIAFSALGAAVLLIPLAAAAFQQPDLVLGRAGQVSILNQEINQGSPLGALAINTWAALGMFLARGDTIVRHNPPGRPVFDLLMLLPFLIGLIWCIRNWRKPAAAALLLWIVVMLGPTILAEDSPHFLRAAGILPGILMIPAVGLSQIWTWTKLPSHLGLALVILLTALSFYLTVNDYFNKYGRSEEAAYWFEAAARDLAESLNRESGMVLIDQRYFEGWPSVSFLLNDEAEVSAFKPRDLQPGQLAPPQAIYSWPYEFREDVAGAISGPALIRSGIGSLAQGDLDPEPFVLFIRDQIEPAEPLPVLANFDNGIQLRDVKMTSAGDRSIQVNLLWSAENNVSQPLVAFVHVEKNGDLIGQSDSVPGRGAWPANLWRPGLIIDDEHVFELTEEFDAGQHQLYIGLYNSITRDRVMVLDTGGKPVSDTWLFQP